MKTASQIAQDILSSNLSKDDLVMLNRTIKEVWSKKQSDLTKNFKVGDHVKWHGAYAMKSGVVIKTMTKNVRVKVDGAGTEWDVSSTLLMKD